MTNILSQLAATADLSMVPILPGSLILSHTSVRGSFLGEERGEDDDDDSDSVVLK